MKKLILSTLLLLIGWSAFSQVIPNRRRAFVVASGGGGGATIAPDTSTAGAGGGAGPLTWSHTTTGANVVLIVWVMANGTVASVVNGSTTMTVFGTTSAAVSGYTVRGYWQAVGAGAGAQTITVTKGTATDMYSLSASYTGCSQTGIPDSVAGGSDVTGGNFAMTTTAVANNCWLVGADYHVDASAQTAGASTFRRGQGAFAGWQLWDSNAAVGTGSQSLNIVNTTSQSAWLVVSIKP